MDKLRQDYDSAEHSPVETPVGKGSSKLLGPTRKKSLKLKKFKTGGDNTADSMIENEDSINLQPVGFDRK